MLNPHPRPRPWLARLATSLAGTCALLVLHGCHTTTPPPIALPTRAPCLDRAATPPAPALRVEALPADADGLAIVRAMALDREALIVYVATAAVLLEGCAR